MKNKIIGAIGAAALITLTAVNAFASGESFNTVISEKDGYVFKVYGVTDSKKAGKRVNLMIFNPNKGFEDRNDEHALQSIAELMTSEGGVFETQIPVYADGINDTGYYDLYISGDDYKEAVKLSVFYASDEDRKTAVNELKTADASGFADAMIKNENILSLCEMGYETLDKNKLAELIYEKAKTPEYLDENDINATVKRLKQAVFIECFNQQKVNEIFKDGKLLFDEYVDFSTIDSDGVTLYNAYENIIKDKSAFVLSVCKGGCKTEEELKDLFAERAFVRAVADPVSGGEGHIKSVLTKENAKRVGIDISRYLNADEKTKSAMGTGLLRAKYSTPKDIESYIRNYSEPSNNGGGSGSGSGGNNKTSLPPITPQEEEIIENPKVFTDIGNAVWAEEAIYSLYEKGVINGVSETEFNPMGNVTREQFVVMLMRAVRMRESSEVPEFADVEEGKYYSGYLQAAKEEGIINGIDENNFGIGAFVKRQDIAVIINNTLTYLGGKLKEVKNVEFSDTVDEYAEAAVSCLANAGIINGFEDNTFRGQETCTRAQAAKLIYETINNIQ